MPLPIALARNAAEVPHWPRQPGAATWLQLRDRQVQSFHYLRDVAELQKAIAAAQP